jgi:asparagine synthase (glutamine-hydrolysing)
MIDGQGADEQLAGYGGNDLALYAGLIAKGGIVDLKEEIKTYRQKFGLYPKGFLIGGFAEMLPAQLKQLLPKGFQVLQPSSESWMRQQRSVSRSIANTSLQKHLLGQVQIAPLPALLRYEDRNSMAFSVESRTPFMDYRLMEFTLGLPERLVYRNNQRKYILREASRNIVPAEILDRKDKMGFVSAEERWLKVEGRNWFFEKVNDGARQVDLFADPQRIQEMLAGCKMKNWLSTMIPGEFCALVAG